MIVGGDGSRYPTNEADRPRREEGAPPEDGGWRENKVGVVARALPGKTEPDGSYTPPTELVKTYVATTRGIDEFGRELRTETERRGVKRAKEVVFISDNGHGMPEMARREFPEAHCVTDFYHVAKRLAAVAAVIKGEGEAAKERRRKLFRQLRTLLWEGKLKALRRRLLRYARLEAYRSLSGEGGGGSGRNGDDPNHGERTPVLRSSVCHTVPVEFALDIPAAPAYASG